MENDTKYIDFPYIKDGKTHSLRVSKEKVLEWEELEKTKRPIAAGISITILILPAIFLYSLFSNDSYGNRQDIAIIQLLFLIFGLPFFIFLSLRSYDFLKKNLSDNYKQAKLELLFKQQTEANKLGFYNPSSDQS